MKFDPNSYHKKNPITYNNIIFSFLGFFIDQFAIISTMKLELSVCVCYLKECF